MSKPIASEYVMLDGVMDVPGQGSFPLWNAEASSLKHEEKQERERR